MTDALQSELLVWHSVKKEGYPPVYHVWNGYEASDPLLLTVQGFNYFTGRVESFIRIGRYRRDLRNRSGVKYPTMGWIDEQGKIKHVRVTHWAIAPKPAKEKCHAQSNRNRL